MSCSLSGSSVHGIFQARIQVSCHFLLQWDLIKAGIELVSPSLACGVPIYWCVYQRLLHLLLNHLRSPFNPLILLKLWFQVNFKLTEKWIQRFPVYSSSRFLLMLTYYIYNNLKNKLTLTQYSIIYKLYWVSHVFMLMYFSIPGSRQWSYHI